LEFVLLCSLCFLLLTLNRGSRRWHGWLGKIDGANPKQTRMIKASSAKALAAAGWGSDQNARRFELFLLEHLVIVSSFGLRISGFPPQGAIAFPRPYPRYPGSPRRSPSSPRDESVRMADRAEAGNPWLNAVSLPFSRLIDRAISPCPRRPRHINSTPCPGFSLFRPSGASGLYGIFPQNKTG
jgi:hypothetical protein